MAPLNRLVAALGLAVLVTTAGVAMHRLLGQPPPATGTSEERAAWNEEIRSEIGLSLPADARVVWASDGAPRDGTSGYFEWVVFSMAPLGIPYAELHAAGSLPVEADEDVRPLERSIWPFHLPSRRDVTRASWSSGEIDVYLTVVETGQGYYSRVQSIRQDR